MRKHPESPRHRLRCDLLERRQVLSIAVIPPAPAEVLIIAPGPLMENMQNVVSPVDHATGVDFGAFVVSGDAGWSDRVGPVDHGGVEADAWHAEESSGWSHAQSPFDAGMFGGSTADSSAAADGAGAASGDPSGGTSNPAASVVSGAASSSSGQGAGATPAWNADDLATTATTPSGGTGGGPADPFAGLWDAGGGFFGRPDSQSPLPFVNEPPGSGPNAPMQARGPFELPEVGATPAASFTALPAAGSPGGLVSGATVNPVAGPSATIGSAVQAMPAATNPVVLERLQADASPLAADPSGALVATAQQSVATVAIAPLRSGFASRNGIEVPRASTGSTGRSGRIAGLAEGEAAEAMPSPLGADLIAQALPFVGDSLERSLDDFVRQLRDVNVSSLVERGPDPIVVAAVTLATTAASAEVARRIVRQKSTRGRGIRVVDPLGRELALSFPELPRSWSEKRS